MIEKFNKDFLSDNKDLDIPLKADGSKYDFESLAPDQKQIFAYIFNRLKEWINRQSKQKIKTATKNIVNQSIEYNIYKLTRMTICGAAGTGKSVLIKTLVTYIREMFGRNDVVFVSAPTGSAGYNAGGLTNHKQFGMNTRTGTLSADRIKYLRKKFANALFVIMDERSMCDYIQLGIIERNCRETALSGNNDNLSFGGIPFIILLGDDFQLPPIDPGAFYCLEKQIPKKILHVKNQTLIEMFKNGKNAFKYLGKDVWYLQQKKRLLDSEKFLERILQGVRGEHGCSLDAQDASHLLKYHLDNFNKSERTQIHQNSIFISATKKQVHRYNITCLSVINSVENPVAKIKSFTTKRGRIVQNNIHYDTDRQPEVIRLTRGAKVYLNGWNLIPIWGLYHGSIG